MLLRCADGDAQCHVFLVQISILRNMHRKRFNGAIIYKKNMHDSILHIFVSWNEYYTDIRTRFPRLEIENLVSTLERFPNNMCCSAS